MVADAKRPMMGRPLKEIRERRLAVEGGARDARAAATRAPRARAGRAVRAIARGAAPDLGRAARHPVGYAKKEPVPAAALMFVGLVAIAVLRRRALPDTRGLIAIAVAALVVAFAASVVPDLVTAILVMALVVAVLENADVLRTITGLGTARFRQALEVA